MTSKDDLINRSLRLLTYHRPRIWWVVSRVFLLTVAVSALGLALSPRYVARTKLTLLPTRSELGFAAARPEMWGLSPAVLLGQTHEEALLSRTLAEDVARTLLEENSPDLNNGGVMGHFRRVVVGPIVGGAHRVVTLLNTGRWETPDPLTSLADGIRSRTRVRNLAGSFVFEISVAWESPKIAARIANLMTERYIQMTLRAGQTEMRTTREYIEARIQETLGDLATLEKQIQSFRVDEKLYASSTDLDLGLQELSQYVRDLNETRVSWEQLDARINALKSYQTPAALAAIEAERAGLKTRQGAVEKVITEQMAKLDKLPSKEAGLLDLYRTRVIKERALTALQDRLLETKVAEAAQLSAARVIDPAIPPLYPEKPLLLRNAVASIAVGLLLSLGLVLVLEARRAGLRSRDDLGHGSASLIGIVPVVAESGHDDPDQEKIGPLAEFFRSLAHGRFGTVSHRRVVKRHLEHLLLRLTGGEGSKICLFVSLTGGEGKTFLIEHLARLAQEAGRRVLLVDGNLPRPALHRAFAKPLSAGLAEVLAGDAAAKERVRSLGERLDLLDAGVATLHGQAHWNLAAFKQQLDTLAAAYDLVLIDSASLRHDPAVVRLLGAADRLVCVFDATASARDDRTAVRHHLRGIEIPVYFVLNKVRHQADYEFSAGLAADRSKPLPGWPADSGKPGMPAEANGTDL